jgi:CheY-like chemotaxis protein
VSPGRPRPAGARREPRRLRLAPMPAGPAGADAGEVLVRCLIVDDNASFVETARRVLDPGGVRVAGTASTIGEALLRAGELHPDVVLVDIKLGDENGFDLARRLAQGRPRQPAVIMISSGAEDDYADLIAESPALGFLPKAELSADGIRRLLGKAR